MSSLSSWVTRTIAGGLVAFAIDDDGILMWLNDRSPAATSFAKEYLLGHDGVGNDINGDPKPYIQLGSARRLRRRQRGCLRRRGGRR